ncbi:hypothetical protein TNCV_4242721 [Trichonephila clavipes]|nr:hypothetical protein TNCV_4242721 [Trichonephila clavipes]
MVKLPCRDPRFTNGICVLKRVENPSNTMNSLDDLRPHGMRKNVALVFKCVCKDRRQTFAQIAEATHFSLAVFDGIHLS